jgi:hypothetical protein
MVLQYVFLSIFIIVIGHYLYNYFIVHSRNKTQLNHYEDLSKQYLKVSEDLSKEQYNRDQMKTDLKEYIKTCI